MDQDERHRIVQALTHHGFVDVSKEPELIADGKKIVRHSDDRITIYAPDVKDRGLFLIEYEEKYYIAINSLDYIIMDFYRKIVNGGEL